MLLANQKLSDSPLLPSDEEALRAQRTWLLLNVLIMTWAFFGVFPLDRRKHRSNASVCHRILGQPDHPDLPTEITKLRADHSFVSDCQCCWNLFYFSI